MKKEFKPELSVVRFGTEDVIATSAMLHWEWTPSSANVNGGYWDLTDLSGKKYRPGSDEYSAMLALKNGGSWKNVGLGSDEPSGTLFYNQDGVMTFRPYSN